MGAIASQVTSLTIVYSAVYSDADQRKYQSSASLAFVRGIHRGSVNPTHKWPVTRKMFPFDDVIMEKIHIFDCACALTRATTTLAPLSANWELKWLLPRWQVHLLITRTPLTYHPRTLQINHAHHWCMEGIPLKRYTQKTMTCIPSGLIHNIFDKATWSQKNMFFKWHVSFAVGGFVFSKW